MAILSAFYICLNVFLNFRLLPRLQWKLSYKHSKTFVNICSPCSINFLKHPSRNLAYGMSVAEHTCIVWLHLVCVGTYWVLEIDMSEIYFSIKALQKLSILTLVSEWEGGVKPKNRLPSRLRFILTQNNNELPN